MKRRVLYSLLAFFSYINIQAQTTVDHTFGKGILNVVAADSTWDMKFAARFQTLFIGDFSLNDQGDIQNASSNFLIRRSRLKFDGFIYHPSLTYKLELGLSNRDIGGAIPETNNSSRIIFDAVLKWNFYKNLSIWAGQAKLPGNRERVISSGDLQFVDRSLVNSNYNIDRDIGVQIHNHHQIGEKFVIREIVAISQGEGRNITVGNIGGYDYTARIELLPFGNFTNEGDYFGSDLAREEKPKFSLGATYDIHDRAVRENGNTKAFMRTAEGYFETDINTLFVDFMFKYQGLSIMGEYADKSSTNLFAKGAEGELTGDFVTAGSGLNIQAGYLFPSNFELAGRYTNITPDSELPLGIIDQYTVGGSKYFVGHKLKVQADISYTQEEKMDDSFMYRLQFDVHF
jgi:hypothetical protein